MKLSRYGERVEIEGRVITVVFIECSRCLRKTPFPVDVAFSAEFVPFSEVVSAREHELSSQELDTGYYRDDKIDIDDLIREQILLAIPMKTLCEKSCRGMCNICGKDLNKGNCGCTTGEMDPRLEPLRKLKESFNKGKE